MEDTIVDAPENNDVLSEEMQKKLLDVLKKYQQLSEEDKKEFHKGAFDMLKKSLSKSYGDTILPTWLWTYQSHILFTFAVLVIIFFFVIVTRKLYRRAKDRENRKEVKRKLKEQKTSKKKKN